MTKLFLFSALIVGSILSFGDSGLPQLIQLGDSKNEFHLTTDPKAGTFLLTPIHVEGKLPEDVSLFLYQDETTGRTLSLQAMKPKDGAQFPVYSGRLDPKESSFVGVELQLRLGGKKYKRFRNRTTNPNPN